MARPASCGRTGNAALPGGGEALHPRRAAARPFDVSPPRERDRAAPRRDRQAVTVSALVEGQVLMLELFQGRTIVEFGTRPGTVFDRTRARTASGARVRPARVRRTFARAAAEAVDAADSTSPARARAGNRTGPPRGWATAQNEVLPGVNALARRSSTVAAPSRRDTDGRLDAVRRGDADAAAARAGHRRGAARLARARLESAIDEGTNARRA